MSKIIFTFHLHHFSKNLVTSGYFYLFIGKRKTGQKAPGPYFCRTRWLSRYIQDVLSQDVMTFAVAYRTYAYLATAPLILERVPFLAWVCVFVVLNHRSGCSHQLSTTTDSLRVSSDKQKSAWYRASTLILGQDTGLFV